MDKEDSKKKAVVLLSGGIDSSTTLAITIKNGYVPYVLSFNYGQRHINELDAAKRIAKSMNVNNMLLLDINMRKIGGSALTDSISVPKDRSDEEMEKNIPVTYVPARNTIFLSFALAWAEVLGANDIFIGVNNIDYSGYPDCRPEFIKSFENMANIATKRGIEGNVVRIHTPLIDMTKAEIIKTGSMLGVDYSLTSSCYDPSEDGKPCGSCDSCILRLRGFSMAGLQDPVKYHKKLRGKNKF
jgi:7-cyano-7-deazaguanine synthase